MPFTKAVEVRQAINNLGFCRNIHTIYIYVCIYIYDLYMCIRIQHCGYTYHTEIDRYVDIHGHDYILGTIYIYTYIYTHLYIYIHLYIYTYIYIWLGDIHLYMYIHEKFHCWFQNNHVDISWCIIVTSCDVARMRCNDGWDCGEPSPNGVILATFSLVNNHYILYIIIQPCMYV
jgi:hypothetical protein